MNVCTTVVNTTTICTSCTGQPFIAAREPRVVEVPNPGWNAGANSVRRLDGDLTATWTCKQGSIGVVMGFAANPRINVTDVPSITHGWHALTINGAFIAQPYEAGYARGTVQAITGTSVLRIDRDAGEVSYFIDDVLQYTSLAPSVGQQLIAATMFAPGDGVDNETFANIGNTSDITGSGSLRLVGSGFGVSSVGAASLRLSGSGKDYGAAPVGPSVGIGVGSLRLVANGVATALGSGTGALRLAAFGAGVESYGVGLLRLKGNGNDQLPQDGFSLLMGQGYLAVLVGTSVRIPVLDEMAMGSSAYGQPTWTLTDTAQMQDNERTVLSGITRLRDSVHMMDSLAVMWKLLLADGVVMGDTTANSLRASMRLVESLILLAGPGSSLTATHAVASTMAMADALYRIYGVQVSDGVALGDAINRIEHATVLDGVALADDLSASLTHRIKIMETALLADTANRTVLFTAAISESLNLGDSLRNVLEGLSRIEDGILLTATFSIDNGVYTAWVCHTAQRAFTQYENYPFNSFAELGGQYLGAAPDGIYELTGSDDAGVPITSRIRTALDNLGTGRMKRMPSMYLGYSSSGTVALKVITTSADGEKEENWYQLTEQPANVTREGRIKLGRGMKSVYWQFELISVSGARFALDDVQLFPLILDRRI